MAMAAGPVLGNLSRFRVAEPGWVGGSHLHGRSLRRHGFRGPQKDVRPSTTLIPGTQRSPSNPGPPRRPAGAVRDPEAGGGVRHHSHAPREGIRASWSSPRFPALVWDLSQLTGANLTLLLRD